MEFWRNLTKEYNQFYQSNQNNKKMMKSDFSRRFKMKSNSLELNFKEFPKRKLKDM